MLYEVITSSNPPTSEPNVRSETRRILLEAAVIVLLGAVLGLSFNYRLVMNAFSGRAPLPPAETAPTQAPFPLPASLAQVQELAAAGAVLIDARAPELYAEGHLPGARSLPLEALTAGVAALRRDVPTEAVLVTYCSGFGCPDSFDLGVALLQSGWREVRNNFV